MNPKWTIEEISRQVHRITFDSLPNGQEIKVLLQTDEHWDNAHCDRALLTRHHQEAVAQNIPILKFGDVFCAMQGKWDKRADQNQLRPEHRGNHYLDRLVDTAGEYYSRFANNIAIVCPGNHETSILNHHQTNLTERLLVKLREKCKIPHMGSYCGFVQFRFRTRGLDYHSVTLCYHHGYGGGGEVTRGLIDQSRTRSQYDADIFISGHIHRRNSDENIIISCNNAGRIIRRQQVFIRSSTYKDEWSGNGWHEERGRAARPKGGWWLKFVMRTSRINGSSSRHIEFTEERAI